MAAVPRARPKMVLLNNKCVSCLFFTIEIGEPSYACLENDFVVVYHVHKTNFSSTFYTINPDLEPSFTFLGMLGFGMPSTLTFATVSMLCLRRT